MAYLPREAAAALSSAVIGVFWTLVDGATTYEIDRKAPGGAFTHILTVTSNGINDYVASDTAYLYRVRAVNGGGMSAYSAPDLATTVIFTDSPLVAGTTVQALHLSELRTAVDAVRALAGLAAAGFTEPAIAGTTIKAVHLTELRSAIVEAREALSLSNGTFTDSSLTGILVQAIHFEQLRDRVH